MQSVHLVGGWETGTVSVKGGVGASLLGKVLLKQEQTIRTVAGSMFLLEGEGKPCLRGLLPFGGMEGDG